MVGRDVADEPYERPSRIAELRPGRVRDEQMDMAPLELVLGDDTAPSVDVAHCELLEVADAIVSSDQDLEHRPPQRGGDRLESRAEEPDERLRAVDEPAHVVFPPGRAVPCERREPRVDLGIDRRPCPLEERAVVPAVAQLPRQVGESGMAGAAEGDHAVEHGPGLLRPVLGCGIEPPLEDVGDQRHLLLHAQMGTVDAEPALIESGGAFERRDAVVGERPTEPLHEPRRQVRSLRIEGAQIAQDVLLGARPLLLLRVVRRAPGLEQPVEVGEEREQVVLRAAPVCLVRGP